MEDGGGSLGADPRKGGGTEQPRFALIEPFALCQLSLNVSIQFFPCTLPLQFLPVALTMKSLHL